VGLFLTGFQDLQEWEWEWGAWLGEFCQGFFSVGSVTSVAKYLAFFSTRFALGGSLLPIGRAWVAEPADFSFFSDGRLGEASLPSFFDTLCA
jgi:hypothetical protein